MSPRRSALRGCVLTFAELEDSNSDQTRALAKELGATVRDDYEAGATTHVIAERAGCMIHRQATVPVVRPTWLSACSEASCSVPVTQYILPPLTGLEIVPSGLSPAEKSEMQKVAENGGAFFTRNLTSSCTHLVTAHASGRKYNFALSAEAIAIVSPRWLFDCVAQQRLLDENLYVPGKEPSANQDDPMSVANTVFAPRANPALIGNGEELPDASSSLFLDAACFLLTGPPTWNAENYPSLRERACRLVALAGATICPRWTSAINYVLVISIPFTQLEIDDIRAAESRGVVVVGLSWLEKCVRAGQVLPVEKYPPPAWNTIMPKPSLDDSLMANNSSVPVSEMTSVFRGVRMSMGPLALRDSTAVALMSQRVASGRGKILSHDASGFVTSGVPTHVMCPTYLRANEQAVVEAIRLKNARVDAVTEYWVAACVKEQKILPARTCILFSPLKVAPIPKMLNEKVTATISGFQSLIADSEWNRRRTTLAVLIERLGGRYSERMRRNQTTVVIADKAAKGSQKVTRAVEWGIPVVGHSWLLACATEGEFVPMDPHLLDTQTLSELENGVQSLNVGVDGVTNTVGPSSPTPMPDATTISLFRRFAAGLNKEGSTEVALKEAISGGEEVARRSRSASLEAQKEWQHETETECDASQFQVIVHRDLTPPSSPKNRIRRKSLPPRAAKRRRGGYT